MVTMVKTIFADHNIEDAPNCYLPFFVNVPHQQSVTTGADLGVVWLRALLRCKIPTIAGDKSFKIRMVAPPAVISIQHSVRTFDARGKFVSGATFSSSLFNGTNERFFCWGNWGLCG